MPAAIPTGSEDVHDIIGDVDVLLRDAGSEGTLHRPGQYDLVKDRYVVDPT